MDDESGRLVDDQQIVILVDDLEGDRLTCDIEGHDRRDVEDEPVARPDHGVGLDRRPAGGQPPLDDQLLDEAP